jgi:hypothetical protein
VLLNWLYHGPDGASVSFIVPPGVAGQATVELWADIDDVISKDSNLMGMLHRVR